MSVDRSLTVRWWPASRLTTMSGFMESGDSPTLLIRTPRVRPDGHGVFTDHHGRLPFYLEYETEPLPTLVAKLDGYHDLAHTTGRVYPVLFWLHSTQREHHLHQRMTEGGIRYPVATAARDFVVPAGLSPADAVWRLHGRAGAALRLTELPAITSADSST